MDDDVRNEVWMDTPAGGRNVKPRVTRVPALRPRKLTWKLSQPEFSVFEVLEQVVGECGAACF